MPSDGGVAIQVTQNGGFHAMELLDGEYVYYAGRGRMTFQVVMTRFMTSKMLIFREDDLPGRR